MQAVILAAGESTRTQPLTNTKPKPLLKIAGKTIIEHNLNQLKGIADEVILVIGYKSEMIKEFLGDSYGKIKISYIVENERLGTAHALGAAAGKVSGKFIAMNGDDLYSGEDIKRCLKYDNCILVKKVDDISRFGAILTDGKKVKQIIEKPENNVTNLANIGLYVLTDKIFEIIKGVEKSPRGEYEIVDAITKLAQTENVFYEEVKKYWLPITYPWNLLEANEFLLANIQNEKAKGVKIEKGATLKGKVFIGQGTIIKSGVYIEGPVMIGANCIIGPNCYIRSATTIGDNCHIGNAVEIKNSIIGDNSNVAHLSYVGDSVIGSHCNFGAGTVVANLRHDGKNIKCMVKGELKDTGRHKLGIIMGDNCKTGTNNSFYPGVKINPGTMTLPGDIIKRDM